MPLQPNQIEKLRRDIYQLYENNDENIQSTNEFKSHYNTIIDMPILERRDVFPQYYSTKVYQIEKDTCIFKFNIAGPICYCADRISQDNILALFPIEDCLIIIDGKNGAVKKYYLQVEKTDADEIKGLAVGKYVFGENTIGTGQNAVSVFQEKWPQTLEAFAEYLCADRNRMIEQEENTGEQIYRYIKGELSENA